MEQGFGEQVRTLNGGEAMFREFSKEERRIVDAVGDLLTVMQQEEAAADEEKLKIMKRDLIAKTLRNCWFAWAHFAGIAVIGLAGGYGIVQSVAGDDAVMVATDLREETQAVPLHGRVSYTVNLERLESCPGEIVTIWSTVASPPAVITLRKPSVYTQVKLYPDIRVSQPMPDNVFPGRWRVSTSLVSTCPTRTWTDLLYTFEVEITPS